MQREIKLSLPSLDATKALGFALGETMPLDTVLLLRGEMGSGKTTLAKSICAAFDIAPAVVISPTYTLVNIYPGRVPVYHVDLFRIDDGDALLDMDHDDWVNPHGPTLIEWPETALGLLDGERLLEISLSEAVDSDQSRNAAIRGQDPQFDNLFRKLESQFNLH